MTSTDKWIAAVAMIIMLLGTVIFGGWVTIKGHDALHEHFPPPPATGSDT